ncbi:cystinosin-like isoform X2 [Asterias amurensis]
MEKKDRFIPLRFSVVCMVTLTVSLCVPSLAANSVNLTVSPQEMTIEHGTPDEFFLRSNINLNETALVNLYSTNYFIAAPEEQVELPPNDTSTKVRVNVLTNSSSQVGKAIITLNSTTTQLGNLSSVFVRIQVVDSLALNVVIIVVGWIYFAAWTVSFYPQVLLNHKRKSVKGLNFDFLTYNLIGFTAYGIFNVGMFWIPQVKEEYHRKKPFGVNPVLLNDVVFTLHAIAITAVTIFQCLIYDRGGQRVSVVCKVLCAVAGLFTVITLIITVASGEKLISWLMFLYYFSYIKLVVSIIKYVPQAWMNYKRKSTYGWSIGNVLLDFTGGSFSLVQMFLLAYNNNDWSSIFGDPTKFGLGFFSILFDVLFIVQHYILYRGNTPYSEESEDDKDKGTEKENLVKGVNNSN